MMKTNPAKTLVARCFLFSLLLSATFFFIFSIQDRRQSTTAPTRWGKVSGIRMRPGYTSYEVYIQRQLNKTMNPKLRKVWTTRDWERKIRVFSKFFSELKERHIINNGSKVLCVGARMGQEVEALKRVGVSGSVGIDLVPYPPLVLRGDFHHQPFDNETFDFEFSNVFDHALYPEKFVGEIERTLKPGGFCVLHVAVSKRADKYSANDLFSINPLKEMFSRSELVSVRKIDGFGLDTEVIFRKKGGSQAS
ncbi:Sterol 24-C-methyltransferase [Bertholletia excelsa]